MPAGVRQRVEPGRTPAGTGKHEKCVIWPLCVSPVRHPRVDQRRFGSSGAGARCRWSRTGCETVEPADRWSGERIEREAGPLGVRDFLPASFGGVTGEGPVTDDMQMTLFTVEGIIRASVRSTARGLGFTTGVVHRAYLRWLDTQQLPRPPRERDGWLQGQQWLYEVRAPASTCVAALSAADREHFGSPADNTSKGSGAVMRSAPFGLIDRPWADEDFAYGAAVEAASYTHGHPGGQAAAGALALMIRSLVRGETLPGAADWAADYADRQGPGGHESARSIRLAVQLSSEASPSRACVESLGAGRIAGEALAIALYCALVLPGAHQALDALALAVSHSGNSDTTGSVCGNLIGAWHGQQSLPSALEFRVEGRATILELADDLAIEVTRSPYSTYGGSAGSESWWLRYPGW